MKQILTVALALVVAGTLVVAQNARDPEVLFKAAQHTEEVQGNLKAAIAQYQLVVAAGNRGLAAQALLRMAACYGKLGDAEARPVYERVVREYADQKDAVALARAGLGGTSAVGQTRGDRAVWTGPYVDLFGQVSADGRFISFTDWMRSRNLMVHDLVQHSDVALTTNPSFVNNPTAVYAGQAMWSSISKDGKQVAYGWVDDTNDVQIRIAALDAAGTAKPRQLLTFKAGEVRFPGAYDWSPDGKWIAMVLARTDGTSQIALAAVADGGALRVLKTTGWQGPDRLFFSPDGRYLAYDLPTTDTSVARDVFVLAADASREIPVVVHPAHDRLMGWSPDGAHVLFSSDRTGSTGLWSQGFANGQRRGSPELVRPDIGASSFSLGLTRAGALYLYRSVGNRDLRVAPIDLATGRLSAPAREFGQGFLPGPRTPGWSRDGTQLAYQACNGDCVAIRSVETGAVRQLPRTVLYPRDPRWAPDGRSLVVAARDPRGRNGLFRLDAQSGAILWTLDGPAFNSYPQWSPDGTKILYLLRRDGVMEHDLQTGNGRQIVKNPQLNYDLSLSPDGRFMAARALDNPNATQTLQVIPAGGGAPRELLRVHGPDRIDRGPVVWTPDGRSLIVAQTLSSRLGLWLVPIDGSTPRTLDLDYASWIEGGQGPLDEGFSLSPDGRSIVFPMGKNSAEVWALENILPAASAKTPGTQRR